MSSYKIRSRENRQVFSNNDNFKKKKYKSKY